MHLAPLIHDLAIILSVAGLVSLIFQKIKQPVVLGYIIAGIIVGPHTPPYSLISDTAGVKIWAELGVIFLMFTLGLEFSFRKLVSVGLPAGFTACFEVLFMIFLGFLTGKWIGWSNNDSLFLGAMLSISSTTIIIKALHELEYKSHRFAEIVFGILIVEDLVAILILVALTHIAVHQSFSALAVASSAYKLLLVAGSWFVAGYFVVPRFIRYVGKVGNNEMLTLISLGLCLALVVFSTFFDYSAALGAFIMGSILAESIESRRIEERMEPLRDLFAAIFFVSVGMLIDPTTLWRYKGSVVLITLITIIGKTVSTTIGAIFSGQPLKTSVQVGMGLTQIGEFSFIIANLGFTLGVTSDFLYPIGVAVSLITTFTTPYMIRASFKIANRLEETLPRPAKALLSQYASWILKQRADAKESKEFYRSIFKWLVNAIIVSVIFILTGEFLVPPIQDIVKNQFWSSTLGWVSAVMLSTPFIWAMLSIFRKPVFFSRGKVFNSTPLLGANFILELVSLIWLGTLSLEFLQAKYVTFIFGSLALSLFTFFYKQIEPYYHWFEKKFISTFEAKEHSNQQSDLLKHLAPWDAHLVKLKVHPNSKFAGFRIADAQLRKRFGVSIVAIQRGEKAIIAPKPDDLIFPQDELLTLATDEQLKDVRPEIEKPNGLEIHQERISAYDLKQILIQPQSQIANLSIRQSKIRENFDALVVGIERKNSRIINPESDLRIVPGDRLWVVGEKGQLERLTAWSSENSENVK